MKKLSLLFVLCALTAPMASSQAIFTGSGDWLDPLRWDTGVVPPDGSTAIVNGDARITQNIVATQTANPSRVEIGSGAGAVGSVTVSGGTLSGAHGGVNGGIYVGLNGGTGALIVQEGATYRSQGASMKIVIGDDFGGTGTISVAGVLQNYKILEIVNGTLEMLPTGQNNLFNEPVPSFIGPDGTLAYVIDGPQVGALERSNTTGLQLRIDPAANLRVTLEGAFAINDSWVLMDYTILNGQFAQGTSFTNQQGYTFALDYGSGSNDVMTLTLVSDALRPRIEAASATPPAISAGQASTIAWTASNFDTLTLDPGGIDVTAAGSAVVSPTATTTYTLSATKGPVTVTREVTVVVDELPEINSFAVTEPIVAPGEPTTLTWDVAGADTVTISPAPGAVGAVGSADVSPAATTTYTLTAMNGTGSVTADLIVTVDALEAAVIHRWDPAGPGQSSGALLDSVGGKNFDMTGGNLLTGLTSAATSLTAAMTRLNPDAITGGDMGLGFPSAETTYELWVQFGSLGPDPQVLFETGGSSDGACILVSESGVRYMQSTGNVTTVDLEAPLTVVNPQDFVQIAVSVNGATGDVNLFVRGAAGGDASASGNGTIGMPNGRGSIFTWSGFGGASAGALGGVADLVPAGTTTFKGAIGLFTIYDRPLSMAEADESFLRIADEIIEGDADDDLLPDYWEIAFFGDLSQGPLDDPDGDSLTNEEELAEGTNPNAADTDGDGLNDDVELFGLSFPSDPTNPDTDGDLLSDGEEVNGATPSDPTLPDTDFDGLWDVLEICLGSDPNDFADLPSDHVGEPWASLHVPGSYPSFNSSLLASDFEDATFRMVADFDEKPAGEREVLFESGGATIGISLSYEAGNQLVFRASGAGGLELATASYTLTAAQIAAGNLDVIVTYDVDDGLGNFDSAIALVIDGVQVATATAPLGGDWTGTNNAAFAVASTNMAGDGTNNPLTGVAFTSGTIDFRKGLIYYLSTLFAGTVIGEIAITDIDYDAVSDEVTITFESAPGRTYAIAKGTDLQTFSPLLNGIPSGGTATTTPPIPTPEESAFFVISEE